MSDIPPGLPASAAQAGFQARETAKERDARRAGEADAAKQGLRSVNEAGSTVETTDKDVAIFGDSEGTGSQGRSTPEEESVEEESEQNASDQGITRGADGQMHIDLEA